MSSCLILTFEEDANNTVLQAWSALSEAGLSNSMQEGPSPPHITLARGDVSDREGLKSALTSFKAENLPVPVCLSSIAAFWTEESAVLFLGITPTQRLLKLHVSIHKLFNKYAVNLWDEYRVDKWVPHCTLAHSLPPNCLPPAIAVVCWSIQLPISTKGTSLDIIRIQSVREL